MVQRFAFEVIFKNAWYSPLSPVSSHLSVMSFNNCKKSHSYIVFSKEFEKELISHNAKYLPYYDSSIDSQLPIGASAIFTSELLGSHDPATGEVIDGMFAHWNKPEGGPLKRGFNLKGKVK